MSPSFKCPTTSQACRSSSQSFAVVPRPRADIFCMLYIAGAAVRTDALRAERSTTLAAGVAIVGKAEITPQGVDGIGHQQRMAHTEVMNTPKWRGSAKGLDFFVSLPARNYNSIVNMPKIFEYFGFIFYFYSNEHEPIHVHVIHGGNESISSSSWLL